MDMSNSSPAGAPTNGALESLSVLLTVPCPACSRPNPVHELRSSVQCFACDAKISTKRIWHEADANNEATKLLSGLQKTSEHAGAHPQLALQDPTCSCGARLSLPGGGGPELPEGDLNCHKCSATFRVRAPSEEARALAGLPSLRFVLSEVIRDIATSEAHPTALKCNNCGALLHTNGKERVVQCEFCKASVELPETMWLRPGSAPKARPFYLLLQPDPRTRLERHYRESALEVRAADAKSPQTSTLALEVLSTMHRPRDLPLLVAQNPSAPESVLIQLAKSDSEKVRLAVLARFERDGGSDTLRDAVAPIREARDRAAQATAAAAATPSGTNCPHPSSRNGALGDEPPGQMALNSRWGKTPEERRANVIGAIIGISVCVALISIFSWLIIFHSAHTWAHSRIVPTWTHVVGSAK